MMSNTAKKTKKTAPKLTIRQFLYKNEVYDEFLIKTFERTYKDEKKYIKDWKAIDKVDKLIE